MNVVVTRWRAAAPRVRAFALALAACAVFAIVFAFLLARDSSVTLFARSLDGEQVSEVAQRLAEWNVPFVAEPDNVRVDARVKNQLLARLSLASVPHRKLESDADLFAKSGPLTPQSVLDAQAREGLASEIAAGLRGLAPIADARVIVAPAVDGTFADESGHPASASVRLSLRPGTTLDRDAAAAVRAYVAAGVPGLEPARVVLLDDRGTALGDERADGAPALAASLQSALDEAFGAASTIVRVRVAYDPRSRVIRETVRTPLAGRPIVTHENDERYASAQKSYGKSATTVDRGSDEREETTSLAADRAERISVAVAVDRARGLDLEAIASLASATLGLVPARGDVVSVRSVTFARSATPAHPPPWLVATGALGSVLPAIAIAAAAAIAVRAGARPLGTIAGACAERMRVERATKAVATYAPAHVRGALRGEPAHAAAAIISALPAATATAVLELYPAEERAAIVARLARAASPAVPDHETVLRRG